MKHLHRVELPYATGGIVSKNTSRGNIIVATPPIFHWMMGKSISDIIRWVNIKKGKIILVTSYNDNEKP